MSIELKQAAEKALAVLGSATSFMSRKARDQHASVVAELRTAIQQAEAQQPATPEPVGEPFCFASVNKHGDVTSTHKRRDSWRTIPLYSHPAPGVPDYVVRNAERYLWLMSWLQQMNLLKAEFGQMGKGEKPSDWWMLNAPYGIDKTRPFFGHGKTADAAIDAAMTAAAQAQKGGE